MRAANRLAVWSAVGLVGLAMAGCASPAVESPPAATAGACDALDLAAYAESGPFAVVDTPSAGAVTASAFQVVGCGRAPEGGLAWRVVDGGETELASGTTSPSCGADCVGEIAFDVDLAEVTDTPDVVTLEVGRGGEPESAPLAALQLLVVDAEASALSMTNERAACADPVFDEVGASLAFVFPTAPEPGATVRSGFQATGCANVFEATVSWRLRGQDGQVIADGFGTATCGTGCVGDYAIDVTYPETAAGRPARLELFSVSMRDGTEQFQNVIPIELR